MEIEEKAIKLAREAREKKEKEVQEDWKALVSELKEDESVAEKVLVHVEKKRFVADDDRSIQNKAFTRKREIKRIYKLAFYKLKSFISLTLGATILFLQSLKLFYRNSKIETPFEEPNIVKPDMVKFEGDCRGGVDLDYFFPKLENAKKMINKVEKSEESRIKRETSWKSGYVKTAVVPKEVWSKLAHGKEQKKGFTGTPRNLNE